MDVIKRGSVPTAVTTNRQKKVYTLKHHITSAGVPLVAIVIVLHIRLKSKGVTPVGQFLPCLHWFLLFLNTALIRYMQRVSFRYAWCQAPPHSSRKAKHDNLHLMIVHCINTINPTVKHTCYENTRQSNSYCSKEQKY